MRAFTLALCAAAVLSPLTATAAAKASAGSAANADARCLMTMAALASTKDENASHIGQAGVVYFAGRIKAEEPGFDFSTRLKAVTVGLTPQTLQSEAQRCGPRGVETLNQLQAAHRSFGPPPGAAAPPPKP